MTAQDMPFVTINPTFLFNVSNQIAMTSSNLSCLDSKDETNLNDDLVVMGFLFIGKEEESPNLIKIENSYELSAELLQCETFVETYQLIKQIEPDLDFGGFYLLHNNDVVLEKTRKNMFELVKKIKQTQALGSSKDFKNLIIITLDLAYRKEVPGNKDIEHSSDYPIGIFKAEHLFESNNEIHLSISCKEEEVVLLKNMQFESRMVNENAAVDETLTRIKKLAADTREIIKYMEDNTKTKENEELYNNVQLLLQKLPYIPQNHDFENVIRNIYEEVQV